MRDQTRRRITPRQVATVTRPTGRRLNRHRRERPTTPVPASTGRLGVGSLESDVRVTSPRVQARLRHLNTPTPEGDRLDIESAAFTRRDKAPSRSGSAAPCRGVGRGSIPRRVAGALVSPYGADPCRPAPKVVEEISGARRLPTVGIGAGLRRRFRRCQPRSSGQSGMAQR